MDDGSTCTSRACRHSTPEPARWIIVDSCELRTVKWCENRYSKYEGDIVWGVGCINCHQKQSQCWTVRELP